MAEKKNKKPRHTQLVVPGTGGSRKNSGGGKKTGKRFKPTQRDRLGRAVTPDPFAPAPAAPPPGAVPHPTLYDQQAAKPAEGAEEKKAEGSPADQPIPGGAPPPSGVTQGGIKPSAAQRGAGGGPAAKNTTLGKGASAKGGKAGARKRRRKKLTPLKRKRRRRLMGFLTVLAVAVVAVIVFTSGIYMTAATLVADAWEGLSIAARPGEGFPTEFVIIGFVKADAMGTNGFVALGEREAAFVSASGRELRRVQHTYMQPGVSAGKTRAVMYSRGGKEYTVESRTKTLASGTTTMDIQFAEMSGDGWLAVASSSRYRSELAVYGPSYDTADPLFVWTQADDRPILATFHSDNRNLLLGCVSAENGALGSTLYVLRTDRDEPTAEIRTDSAQLLEAHYLQNHNILAVYDTFTALYNQRGEELARYGYGQRRLLNADVYDGRVALAFGSTTQETLHTVLLDSRLETLFDVQVTAGYSTVARVLADSAGAFLLCGQQVIAYDTDGMAVAERTIEQNVYTLAHGGAPLVLASGLAESLTDMLHPSDDSSASASGPASLQSPGSGSQESGSATEPGSDTDPDSVSAPAGEGDAPDESTSSSET